MNPYIFTGLEVLENGGTISIKGTYTVTNNVFRVYIYKYKKHIKDIAIRYDYKFFKFDLEDKHYQIDIHIDSELEHTRDTQLHESIDTQLQELIPKLVYMIMYGMIALR